MTDTSNAPELLPCPFCGGEAEISQYGDRKRSTQYQCLECGCHLETGEEWGYGNLWNMRYVSNSSHNVAKEALQNIENPVIFLRRLPVGDPRKADGQAAFDLAENAAFLRGIARTALRAIALDTTTPTCDNTREGE